jgi:hypothetical protein
MLTKLLFYLGYNKHQPDPRLREDDEELREDDEELREDNEELCEVDEEFFAIMKVRGDRTSKGFRLDPQQIQKGITPSPFRWGLGI